MDRLTWVLPRCCQTTWGWAVLHLTLCQQLQLEWTHSGRNSTYPCLGIAMSGADDGTCLFDHFQDGPPMDIPCDVCIIRTHYPAMDEERYNISHFNSYPMPPRLESCWRASQPEERHSTANPFTSSPTPATVPFPARGRSAANQPLKRAQFNLRQ